MADRLSSQDSSLYTLENRSSFDQMELSYGIELQFMIAYSAAEVTSQEAYREKEDRLVKQTLAQGKSYEDLNEELALLQRELVRQKVRSALRGFQIPLAADPNKSRVALGDYDVWTVTGDSTVTANKSIIERPNFHFLDGKCPYDEPNFDEYKAQVEFADIKLVSPIWSFSELYTNSEETRKVIRIIASRFSVFLPPRTAGFHVHVGNGDLRFTLQQTQNMALLFSNFERQFNQFHPAHRLNSANCQLPRSLFRPADRDMSGMWNVILNLPQDRDELEVKREGRHKVLHGDEARLTWLITRLGVNRFKKDTETSQAYNFRLVLENKGARARTVEFRQHRATVNLKIINGWVLVVCAMVQVCCQAPNVSFLDGLLERREEDLNFPVTELFHELHLDELVDQGTIAGHPVREHEEKFGWRDLDYYQKYRTYNVHKDNKYDGNKLSKYFRTNMGTWSVSSVGSAMIVDRSRPTSWRRSGDWQMSPTYSARSPGYSGVSPTDSERSGDKV